MLGSTPAMGSWNPNAEGGKGGMRMTWSEGHVWYAEVPYESIKGADSNFEFKFVVKFNENDGRFFRVIRWEGGNLNHKYDDSHVKQMLNQPNVQ